MYIYWGKDGCYFILYPFWSDLCLLFYIDNDGVFEEYPVANLFL